MFLADACAILAFFAPAGRHEPRRKGGHAGQGCSVADHHVGADVKAALGTLLPLPTERGRFHHHPAALSFRQEPLGRADAEVARRLPPHHKNPMDRG